MTLQQFEYIVALEKFRHFTKAAEYCNVTQPTLSAMIQKLEDELEVKIFDRSQQPIAPTAAGQLVIKQAKEVLVQAEQIKNVVQEQKQEVCGKFTLGVLPTIAPYLLPRFISNFTQKYPKLELRIAELKTHEIKRALLSGDIDAGILADIEDLEEYNISHLFYEQYMAYVSKSCPLYEKQLVKSSDLQNHQLWLLDEGHCFRDQMVKYCQIKSAQQSQMTYSLGSIETFMRMVESGCGVTFIPWMAAQQLSECQKDLVRPFAIPIPTRHLVAITNKNFIRHTIMQAIVEEVQASVPKSMHSLATSQVAVY